MPEPISHPTDMHPLFVDLETRGDLDSHARRLGFEPRLVTRPAGADPVSTLAAWSATFGSPEQYLYAGKFLHGEQPSALFVKPLTVAAMTTWITSNALDTRRTAA